MILPGSSIKNSFSSSTIGNKNPAERGAFRLIASISLAIVCAALSPWPAHPSVSVEIGPEGGTVRSVIDAPNLDGGKTGGAPGVSWNDPGAPMETETPSGPPQPEAVFTGIGQRSPHAAAPAASAPKPGPPSPMNTVLRAEGGNISISGSGTAIRVAKKDATVELEPFLYTYRQAKYALHLFDVNGAEITFDSKPIFHWFRPDDKSNFPAYFQGRADGNSLKSNGPGDFSARPGLKYNFEIKKGQRVEVETQGNPDPRAFIKVKSEAF